MPADLEVHRDELGRLCRLHGVAHLDLFGSATGEAFDPAHSDIDFIVDFGPQAQPKLFEHYFALKRALEELLGRQVDLVMAGAMTNPYFIESAQRTRRRVYASPLAEAA
jgi:predicted nucleotidyltransferase